MQIENYWKYANWACSIIGLWLEGNISPPVKYSNLSTFQNDKTGIFAASLLTSYFSLSSLILSSIIIISFYIFSKRFFLERKG